MQKRFSHWEHTHATYGLVTAATAELPDSVAFAVSHGAFGGGGRALSAMRAQTHYKLKDETSVEAMTAVWPVDPIITQNNHTRRTIARQIAILVEAGKRSPTQAHKLIDVQHHILQLVCGLKQDLAPVKNLSFPKWVDQPLSKVIHSGWGSQLLSVT